MKKFTMYLKAVAFLIIVSASSVKAQAPCNANFVYTLTPAGVLTFSSTTTTTNSSTNYLWYIYCYTNPNFQGVTYGGLGGSYTFSLNGTYQLSFSILNSAPTCSAYAQQTMAITNTTTPCGLQAGFSYFPMQTGGMYFVNNSTGATGGTTYSWNFGDSLTLSSQTSPVHTYSANGSYNVVLTASNSQTPGCVSTQTVQVQVNSYCTLVPAFTYSVGNNGLVNFVSTSTGTTPVTSFSWNLGNSANGSGPTTAHTYPSGSYTVLLTATNNNTNTPNCSGTASQVIVVTNTCAANAGFSLMPSGTPQLWNAFPSAPSNVINSEWNWGDGSFSNTLYTSHTYSTSGNYSICLSVTIACGASDMTCSPYAIFKTFNTTQSLDMIKVNVIDPATVSIKSDNEINSLFTILPNPSNGSFNVSIDGLKDNSLSIDVYDAIGKLIYNQPSEIINGSLKKEISLDNVPNGVYFLKINAGEQVFSKKIIVKN